MEQLPALTSASAVSGHAAHQQPDSGPAEPAPALLTASPHSHHGEVLHVQQARLDLVRSTFTGHHTSRAKCAATEKPPAFISWCLENLVVSTFPSPGNHRALCLSPALWAARRGPMKHTRRCFICRSRSVSGEGSQVLRKKQGQQRVINCEQRN